MADHVQEELLQQYFDGELAPTSAADISRHLEQCDPCADRHRALFALHEAIGRAAEDSAKDVDFEALFARIEQGVREQPAKGVAGGALCARMEQGGREQPAPGLGERTQVWWREQLDQRSRRMWMPAAGAIAAAAVVLLLVGRALPTDVQEVSEPAPAPAETAATEPPNSSS